MVNLKNNIDELIQIAKIYIEKPKNDEYITPIKEFLIAMNIKHGPDKIPAYYLYILYTNWNKNKKAYSQVLFFKEIKKYLEHKRHSYGNYYLIDLNELNVSKVQYEEIKNETAKYEEKVKKAKKARKR